MNSPRRRSPLIKVLTLLLALGVIALVALFLFARGPKPVKTKNILGEVELCQSCHPAAQHPEVKGHERDLGRIGCLPCHGGDGSKLDKAQAHAPALGDGRNPFLPKGHYQVACARCHIPGQVAGMDKLLRGLEAYRQGTCVGCHGPGHQPPEIGPSLRVVPQKSPKYLRRWLLDSRAVLPTAAMWSIRDGTYRGHFADTKQGNANLEALIDYVLMAADEPQRRAYGPHAQRPKLRVDTSCVSCHQEALGKAAPKGKGGKAHHRCSALKTGAGAHRAPLLDCKRCHGTAATRAAANSTRLCPQIAAAAPLCETCHLRQDDGLKELSSKARLLRSKR